MTVLTPLYLEYVDGKNWRLLNTFVYEHPVHGRIEVPAGFVTDFNSVPRFFWRIIPPTEFGEAAVVHDYLYRNGIGTKKAADEIYRDILKEKGASWWRRTAMFNAVRLFGDGSFKDKK